MEQVKDLIKDELLKEGFILDDVKMFNEGPNKILQITIDKESSVDLDDCVAATHIINKILDEKDPIEEKYILEVCSKQKGGDYLG